MALDLIIFDELKALLGLSKTEADYPALEIIEKRIVAAVEGHIGRELALKERTAELDITFPTRQIRLKALPVVSVSSVTLQYFGEEEDIDSDEYMISSFGLKSLIRLGPGRLVVVYTGGYANKDIPAIIRQAATIQAAYEFQTKDHIGAEQISTEGGTKTVPALALLGEVKDMLRRERHPLLLS